LFAKGKEGKDKGHAMRRSESPSDAEADWAKSVPQQYTVAKAGIQRLSSPWRLALINMMHCMRICKNVRNVLCSVHRAGGIPQAQ
jgi:hypothetical protein